MDYKDYIADTRSIIKTFFRIIYLLLLIFICFLLYLYFFEKLIINHSFIFPIIGIWLLSAYVFLPRIHRWFSRLYLPKYYLGRARTFDGLLGDPINIAIIGNKKQLVQAMNSAGWQAAENLSFKSSIKMVRAVVFKKPYPNAPVSSLFLFHKKQELAFQMEENNNPKSRHHVRFWPTPKHWWLPGGYKVNWLGSATFDKKVGFSSFTLQFTHKIEENTDIERDFVVKTIKKSTPKAKINIAEHFNSGYFDRNGGGDSIRTDGALPFINLRNRKE